MPDAPPPVRRRRSAAQLEREILEATWQELTDHGWSGLTMDGVARRAAVSKASLYQRWTGRGPLVRAAMQLHGETAALDALQPVGDLRTDLRDLLAVTADYLDGPGGEAMRGTVSDPVIGEHPILEAQVALVDRLLDHALSTGELGGRPIPLVIRNCGLTVVIEHFLFLGAAPPPDQLDVIVDDLWLPALLRSSGGDPQPQ